MPDHKITVLDISRCGWRDRTLAELVFVKLSFTELEPYESLFEKILIFKGHSCYYLYEKSLGFIPTLEALRWVANSSYASPSRQYLLKFRHKWTVRETLMGGGYEGLWIGELLVELGGGESYGSDEEIDKEEFYNHGPEVVSSVKKPREGSLQADNARPGA